MEKLQLTKKAKKRRIVEKKRKRGEKNVFTIM
jgi:hypothetical protein